MKKFFVINTIILCAFFSLSNISYSYNKHNNLKKIIYVNNINEEDIKIQIINVETINSAINLDEIYEGYSIITLNVVNTGLDCIELSNIDYSFYQNNKKLETFIESENKFLGFVGTLESGEQKEVKIGLVLAEKNTPIKLFFKNLNYIKR